MWLTSRDSREVLMQFGKIHGLALAILGVVLLGLQAWFYMAPNKVIEWHH